MDCRAVRMQQRSLYGWDAATVVLSFPLPVPGSRITDVRFLLLRLRLVGQYWTTPAPGPTVDSVDCWLPPDSALPRRVILLVTAFALIDC